MENAPPPEHGHTCPGCNRPVEPGYAYCEACGTPLMEHPVCDRCGALFMGPVRFCEACGAPAVVRGAPDDGALQPSAAGDASGDPGGRRPGPDAVVRLEFRRNGPAGDDEDDRQGEDEAADYGPGEGDKGEPLAGPPGDVSFGRDDGDDVEFVGEDSKEKGYGEGAGVAGQPSHARSAIVEPDTNEIMDRYWDEVEEEYGSRTPARPGKDRGTHGPAAEPAQPEAVDDALFLVPDRPPEKKKDRAIPVRAIAGIIIVIALLALIWFAVLPFLSDFGDQEIPTRLPDAGVTDGSELKTTITRPGTGSPVPLPTTVPARPAPQRTQTIPGIGDYYFEVKKDTINARITVTFTGSTGIDGIDTADITVTREDGAVATGVLMPRKGIPEMTLQGSTGTDRVVIIAHLFNGESYRVYDAMVAFRG